MVGDRVPTGTKLRVRVQNGAGSFLRLVTTGSRFHGEPVPVTSLDFEHEFEAPAEPGWVRAELFDPDLAAERSALCDNAETTYCRNMLGITAMTSAMYLRAGKPPCPKSPRCQAPVKAWRRRMLLLALGAAAPARAELQAGAANADLTPPIGTPMFAYTARSNLADGRPHEIPLQIVADPDSGLYAKTFAASRGIHTVRARGRSCSTRASRRSRSYRWTSAGSRTRSCSASRS